ncbi:hypothetical protein EYF80_018094 [Liparis tanakae]|uniref:Uncharacterized protein n=1 Tax=Liparis tanakae TaxID=230148 RepID=A0A4Z2I3C5_9TELE|nr:hypothetical protein EYF80_018094 [Liparis tanakae]
MQIPNNFHTVTDVQLFLPERLLGSGRTGGCPEARGTWNVTLGALSGSGSSPGLEVAAWGGHRFLETPPRLTLLGHSPVRDDGDDFCHFSFFVREVGSRIRPRRGPFVPVAFVQRQTR